MKEIALLPEVVELQPPQPRVTSLENLGITTRRDELNLASKDLRLIKFDDPHLGCVYFAGLEYPFMGTHLTDFLNVVAPHKDQDIYSMKADLAMPLEAQRAINTGGGSFSVGLHKAHFEDKKIGGIYRNYVGNHAQAWLDVALNNRQDDFFNSFEQLQFVDTDIYSQRIAQHLQAGNSSIYGIYSENIIETAVRFNKGRPFELFLSQEGIPIGRKDLNKIIKDIKHRGRFSFNDAWSGSLARPARSFLGTLSLDDQKKAALYYATKIKNQLLIDPVAKRYFDGGFLNRRMEFFFGNDGSIDLVPIFAEGSQTIEVGELNTTTGVYQSKVRNIHFPARVREEGLYPALVWKNNGRGPELLGQKSLIAVSERAGLAFQKHWDTLLGVAMAAYFSPEITDNWESEMTLEAFPGVKQPMRAAQMALWPSVPKNRRQLAKKAVILQKVEGVFEQ